MTAPPIKLSSLSVRKYMRGGITKHLVLDKSPTIDSTDFSVKPPVLARLEKSLFVVLKLLKALLVHITAVLLN
jgi:hypothetical protein